MKFKVFHDVQCSTTAYFAATKPAEYIEKVKAGAIKLSLVAEVDCADIDVAFELTNHITGPWQFNEGVLALPNAHRSTSVGDVIVDEAGVAHLCAPVGWSALGATVETPNKQLVLA